MFKYLIAVLPTVILISYILGYDKYNKEPKSLCLKLFVYGCFSVILAIIGEKLFPPVFHNIDSFKDFFYDCLIHISLIEETVKYCVVLLLAYKAKAFDEIYDGIIYCVMVSLGFATIENLLYVYRGGLEVAYLRAITAVPAHTIFAVSMGYFLGLSKADSKNHLLYLLLSIVSPILLHAIYDFIIMARFNYWLIIFIIYFIVIYRLALKRIHRVYNLKPFK